jgi:hypothetical protein
MSPGIALGLLVSTKIPYVTSDYRNKATGIWGTTGLSSA